MFMVTKPQTDELTPSVDPLTVKWLYDLANSNFKAQTDLYESFWRSLSFVAALFALSIAEFRGMQPHVSINGSWFECFAGAFYILGIVCFMLAFLFLVWIVWEREFLHPAKDGEVKQYAAELTHWHRSRLQKVGDVGAIVVVDLELFMVDLLVKANDRNLPLITRRLAGRSRAIVLMLAGFAFLCASEASMFLSQI